MAVGRSAPDVERADETVVVGGGPTTIADVVAVACRRAAVSVHPEVSARLVAARAVVDRASRGEIPIYGLTTGLGAAVDTRLSSNDVASFQRRAILARAVAVGEPLTTHEVRAALFVRLAGLARGVAGATPGFVPAIRDMLNSRVHPVARRTGSIGEADLAPLAGLFLPFAGEGKAEFQGRVVAGSEALRLAGIAPPELGPKDGLALINANAFSVGLSALALAAIGLAAEALTVSGALSLEAFRANLSPLDPRVVALRPAPGQADMSARLRSLLDGSDLFEPGQARRVQDPLSFRCLAPVHGALALRLADAVQAVEADLGGAGDSPAVLVDSDEMLSSVNFDTTAIALALESLGSAAAHAANLAAFRILKLMSPAVADLPRFLTRRGGSRSGFAPAQKTAVALEAEIRHLALPLGPMTAPVADGIEDYAPMTPRIAEKLHTITRRLARLAAVELVVAAVAVDLREQPRLGRGTARAHRFVRERVPPLDEDRATGEDFEAVAAAIEAGELAEALQAARP